MASNSTPKFTTLPTEILQAIAGQVSCEKCACPDAFQNLTSFNREYLWRSITIDVPEGSLDYFPVLPAFPTFPPDNRSLNYTREVHFTSGFVTNIENRCPHCWKKDKLESGEDDVDAGEDEGDHEKVRWEDDVNDEYARFEPLEQSATSLIGQLQKGTLRSLSWDIGSCLPREIYGWGSQLCNNQPQLESLSITSDCFCDEEEYYPMGAFDELKNLRRLRWRAPGIGFIPELSGMISRNAENLQHLEVDLMNWERVETETRQSSSYKDSPHGFAHSIGFWQVPEGKISGPTYPALQTLCLTEVGLTAAAVTLFDFSVLRTLKWRNVENWQTFLENAVRLRLPINLKTLEIHARPGPLSHDADEVLLQFLAAFDGLQELYVSLQGPLPANLIWEGVINHRATLKTFVHHLRTVDHDPDRWQELDEAELGLNVGNAFLDSLDKFQLEALGLSLRPEDMIRLFLPFARTKSLKLLHLRQSAADFKVKWYPSNFFELDTEQKGSSDDEDGNSDGSGSTDESSEYCSLRMREQLRHLAEWAFGPDGIPSLKVIACGDYAYGGRPSEESQPVDVMLCRPEAGSQEGVRILNRFDNEWREEREEIIDEYRDFLEACPVNSLLLW